MKTLLVLKATAGLRLLPEHQANALLMEVRKVFSASPFLVPENSVSILNGTDEGVLAWITVNFLTAQQNRTFRSHCFPAAMDADWTFDGVTYRYTGPSDGLEGFDVCYTEVRRILQRKIHLIKEIQDIRFYAFSYYYDRAVDTSLIEYEDGGELAVRDFALKAQEVCDHMDGVTWQSPFLCMDLTYITALLRHGFGFREDTTLQLAKKVRGVETGWALGAIFRELQALEHRG
ncbi:nucleoside diphosphate phosphatase ENTPD5 [Hyla sarda]|uniref:nucleoside diphosphate phosphatase ENTPD5 n=1 Tax=Hyla sarda TaxID=327740 RepID=UPI0024C3F2B6|nr:nucleoside diphosphate phosphatase ENTPD5 [Hyla sarda]